MDIFLTILFLVIGLFVGSFLNVIVLRWGTKRSFVSGRSRCAHTGEVLPWHDMVPVFSFVALKGKSRFSGKPISWQYPLVEVITGILFAGTYWKVFVNSNVNALSYISFIIYLAIISILIVISFYDLKTKIIPNKLVYSFIVLSGLTLLLKYGEESFNRNVLAAVVLWFPFAFLWFVSRGTWMGYGDAKLAWGIGWLLGLIPGVSAVMLSFWIGAIVALFLLALKKLLENKLSFLPKNLTIKSEVPFAPFLVLGTLLVFFFEINVFLFF